MRFQVSSGALEKNVAVVVNSGYISFRAEPTGFNRLDMGGGNSKKSKMTPRLLASATEIYMC